MPGNYLLVIHSNALPVLADARKPLLVEKTPDSATLLLKEREKRRQEAIHVRKS
jgi:hypothetical protein